MNKFIPGLVLFVMLTTPAHAQNSVDRGVAWLLSQQKVDGSICTRGEHPVVATSEALLALHALGLADTAKARAAGTYLSMQHPEELDLALRRLIALQTGPFTEPFATAEMEMLLSEAAKSPMKGPAFAPGFSAGTVEHALALRTVAHDTGGVFRLYSLEPSVRQLLSRGILGGGIGHVYGEPDSMTTGLVIEALGPWRIFAGISTTLDNWIEVRFLENQAQNGAIGDGTQPVLDTAQGLLALHGASPASFTINLGVRTRAACDFLTASQGPDGDWENSVYATALVLRALACQRPNLSVPTDELGRPYLVFSNPNPLSGDPVKVLSAVVNRSGVQAPASIARFYAVDETGGSVRMLGETAVRTLEAGESADLSVTLPSSGLSGRQIIRVAFDADNLISETDKSDNTAEGVLEIRRAVNLLTTRTDISFSEEETQLTIRDSLHCRGEATGPFSVRIFRGNPDTGGLPVGTTVLEGLGPGETTEVTATIDRPESEGPLAFHVVVDPFDEVSEANEDDNRAFRIWFPGTAWPVDLAIAEVRTEPEKPRMNERYTLVVTLENLASADAAMVGIAVFSTEIFTPGVMDNLLAFQEADLVPGKGRTTVRFSLSDPGSYILVVADPYESSNDTNRSNNRRTVSLSPAPALSFSMHGLTYSNPVNGRRQLTASITNSGKADMLLPVAFYRGNPLEASAIEIERTEVCLTAAEGVSCESEFMTFVEGQVYGACIDPEDTAGEENTHDNCATMVWTTSQSPVDLSVSGFDISFAPAGALPGDPLHVTACIVNGSNQNARASIRLWQSHPRSPAAQLLAQTTETFGANTVQAVEWEIILPEGDHNLWVSIDDVLPRDSRSENNLAARSLYLKGFIRSVSSEDWRYTFSHPVVGDVFGTGQPVIFFMRTHTYNNLLDLLAYQIGSDGQAVQVWCKNIAATNGQPGGLALADLENDGTAELVYTATLDWGMVDKVRSFIGAVDPYGQEKWSVERPQGNTSCRLLTPSLGDINGDGVVDVVSADTKIFVLDGANGSLLLEIPGSIYPSPCAAALGFSVLDMEGDGVPEILMTGSGGYGESLFSSMGDLRWQHACVATHAVVDLDLDGFPEVVLPNWNNLRALDGISGRFINSADIFGTQQWYRGIAVMDARQDGCSCIAVADNSGFPRTGVVGPSFETLWVREFISMTNPYEPIAADLLGLGRAQVINVNYFRGPVIQDSRTGEVLIDLHHVACAGEQDALVADVDGDGSGELVTRGCCSSGVQTFSPYDPKYPPADLLIFGSPHWQKMPTVWNSPTYVRGQVDEQLRFQHDYQPWRKHNTWMQQFDTEPVRLLPDLEIALSDIALDPPEPESGSSAVLSATIHNVGGLPTENVPVEFFDGDPDAGGRLIGTVSAPGPISVRGGTATVSVSWTPYPDGVHLIHVRVNHDHTVEESGYEANAAKKRFFVRQGENLSDLALADTDLSVDPENPIAGTLATITVTVHNLGVRDSGSFEVELWDGVPGPGSTQLGRAAVASLAPGSSGTASITTTFGPGGHYLCAVADPDQVTLDSDLANNSAFITFAAPLSGQPDLMVMTKNVLVSPNPITQGRTATVSAVVYNFGTEVSNPMVHFYLGDPDQGGIVFAEQVLPGLFVPGGEDRVQAMLSTDGLVGTRMVFVRVDPDNLITETYESNNTAGRAFDVTPPDATLVVTTDQSEYPASSEVLLIATITSASAKARALSIEMLIEQEDGTRLASVVSGQGLILRSGETRIVSGSWTTGEMLPGAYQAHAMLREGETLLSESRTSFAVIPDRRLFALVTVDKASYLPGEEVLLRQQLRNDSLNSATGPLVSIIQVGPGGAHLTETRQIAPLPIGGTYRGLDPFRVTRFLAPGTYPVSLTVTDANGLLLMASTTSFEVKATAPAQALLASLQAQPAEFWPGQDVEIGAQLENTGNVAVTDEPVAVHIRDAATLELNGQVTTTVTVSSGESVSVTLTWPSPPELPLGEKLAVLDVGGEVLTRILLQAVEEKKEVSIEFPKGWSMISLPVQPDVATVSNLFPGAVVVYRYQKGKGYVRVTGGEDLKVGMGYWILLNNPKLFDMKGTEILEYTIPVADGWYMIGGCTLPVKKMITSGKIGVIYGYKQGIGYQWIPGSDPLEPGKGYWILFTDTPEEAEFTGSTGNP